MNENEISAVQDEAKAFRAPHNPSNFHPEDYEILDYLDNQPPRYIPHMFAGASAESRAADRQAFDLERAEWVRQMDAYFPNRREQKPSIHQCTHCGNGTVRYIVAALHKPSGQNVVFGSTCVARLGFANQDDFKLAQIKARAEQGNARMAAYAARLKFLELPEAAAFKAAIEDIGHEAHKKNDFARDILSKFNQYGSVSPRQMECFVSSLQRDHEYAAKRAAEALEVKGPVPVGRSEFLCVVISTRWQENDFGGCMKMLVKLENNSRIWMTVPAAAGEVNKGDKLRIKATVEASKDDPSFGFGKRPNLVAGKPHISEDYEKAAAQNP